MRTPSLRPLKRKVLDYAQQHRWGSAYVARIAAEYLRWYLNHDYRTERNGEAEILRRLAHYRPLRVFDVGANIGEWSAVAVRFLPEATIDSFEIAPSMAQSLAARFAGEPRVHPHAIGLSDQAGTVEIDFFMAGGSTGTTMLVNERVHTPANTQRQTATVEVGDTFCRDAGIERIDFLKIDVEGAEPKVLRGFERMFAEERVGLVQFEYNSLNIGSRWLLADAYAFFETHGFVVGKLYARGASYGPYDFQEENFRGPNYLAIHQSLPALRRASEYHPPKFR